MTQKSCYGLQGGRVLEFCQGLTQEEFQDRPALVGNARIALFVLFVARAPLGCPESVGEEKGCRYSSFFGLRTRQENEL